MIIRKKTFIVLCFLSFSLLVSRVAQSNSEGAVSGNNGAPGEKTCNEASCHNDNNIIKSSQALNILVADDNGTPVNKYENGKTYDVTISLAAPMKAAGFSAEVLVANKRVRNITAGVNNQSNGFYVTHKNPNLAGPDLGQWKFKWTAPKDGMEEAILYTAANQANGDAEATGDFIHVASMKIPAQGVNISSSKKSNAHELHIYPSPALHTLSLASDVNLGTKQYDVFSINGARSMSGTLVMVDGLAKVDISSLQPGAYIISIHGGALVKAFIKQ